MVNNSKTTQQSAKPHQDLGIAEYDLKSIRESKGLTLRAIFERTRISVANLAAIENGDFHLLPPPVFTKSFIKIYAKALDIDSDVIIARYEQYLETLNPTYREAKIKDIPKSTRLFYKVFLWGSLIIITVGLVTFSLSTYETLIDVVKDQISEPEHKSISLKPTDAIEKTPQSEAQDQPTVASGTQEGSTQPIPLAQAQPAVSEAQEKQKMKQVTAASEKIDRTQVNTDDTYKISVEAKDLTWLRITADDDPPYEILLQPGEKIERDASRFIIDVGNAGGIDITFQGKSMGNLGEPGQVVHLKLP
jgi:cytoskeletal protein RodZ